MKKINSTDIARKVGVSRSTVSKVMNGYPSISEETKKKVMKAIEEVGYSPDISGRMLTGKGTDTLALIFFSRGNCVSTDLLVNRIISAVIETAAKYDYHILSYIFRYPVTEKMRKEANSVFSQRRADAAIIVGARNEEPLVEDLVKNGHIVSIYDQEISKDHEPNRIVINQDDEGTAYHCMEYLHSLGHKEVGFLNGDIERHGGKTKQAGFHRGIKDFALKTRDEWSLFTDFSEDSGYESMKKILGGCSDLPSAFAIANDSIAFGAIRAIQEAGLSIPEDISVIAIDGHPLSGYIKPKLTTFNYDLYDLADQLVHSAISQLKKSKEAIESHKNLKSKLVIRETCRKLNA